MDVNTILTHLVQNNLSFPAMKLAWTCQLDLPDLAEIPKISPSHYIREIELSTEERYSLLCQQQKKLEFWKPGFAFTVTPSIVVFQKYGGGETLRITLNIRNISKQPQKVQILMDENDVFSLEVKSTRIAKFASGMTISAVIRFVPEDDKDYLHKIIVATKETRFAIPILGIGGRAILNIPDKIDLKKVPVKFLKDSILTISNTGTKFARFTLSTDGPFSVTPEKGVVAPNDSFSLTISYFSELVGVTEGFLCVKFDNGEEIYTKLLAEAINSEVYISPSQALLQDTYIGLKTKETITIINNMSVPLNFIWKKYPAKHEHSLSGSGGGAANMAIYNEIRKSFENEPGHSSAEITPGDLHVGHILKPEPLFEGQFFVIEPLIGKILPHSSKEVHILFQPQDAESYTATAYCDITGQEERIPFQLTGKGLGAKFRFAFDSLDTGEVYLGGGHTYEIPVTNTSEIKGTLIFDGLAGLMPNINVKLEPRKLKIAPGHFSAFYVSFNCTGNPGTFLEQLNFRSASTDEIYSILIKGRVNFPKLHFSMPMLEFGEISYGFPKLEQILLFNDTLNCVDINMHMDEDGVEPALTFEDVIASFEDPDIQLPIFPKEFLIEPTSFKLQPKGFQRISITLLSNNYGEYCRKLLVCIGEDPFNSGDPVHSLPIFADCVSPSLTNARPDIVLTDLYVGFPYPDEFQILNNSNLPGIYCLVPVHKDSTRAILTSDKFVGILKPKKVTPIPFKLTCNVGGHAYARAELYLAGKHNKVMDLEVKASSAPCKLETNIKTVEFGEIPVMVFAEQEFEVINDSPLTIPYKTVVVQGGNVGEEWVLTPAVGALQPYDKCTIKVEVKLRESGEHSGTIRIQMTEANAYIEIKVKATGFGTSLEIMEPDRRTPRDIAVVDFGVIFTKTDKSISFDIKNLCFFPKVLEWRLSDEDPPENEKPKRRGPPRVSIKEEISRFSGKKKELIKKHKKPVFSMEPTKILLAPNASVTMTVKTTSETPKSVEEEYFLWSYTPQNLDENAKHLNKLSVRSVDLEVLSSHQAYTPIIARRVTCKVAFEIPRLIFSKKSIVFRIDASPYDDSFEQKASVKIENPGRLPVPAIFQTEFPFTMFVKGFAGTGTNNANNLKSSRTNLAVTAASNPEDDVGTYDWSYTFEPGSSINMTINFDGRHVRRDQGFSYFDSHLRIFFEGHPDSVSIPLKGEVHFPSVECDKKAIDFGTIPNGGEAVDTFTLTNQCNFCLTYKWFVRPNSTFIKQRPTERSSLAGQGEGVVAVVEEIREKDGDGVKLPEHEANKGIPKRSVAISTPGTKTGGITDLPALLLQHGGIHNHGDKEAAEELYEKSSDDEDYRDFSYEDQPDEFGASKSMTHLNLFGDSIQYVRDKIHRTKFMDIVGLRDPAEEDNIDEVNYLQKHNPYKPPSPIPNSETAPFSSSTLNLKELIDITPLSGIIQAGQAQRFTIVFYGHSEVQFKTILTCFLEGGTSKQMAISGKSTKSSAQDFFSVAGKGQLLKEIQQLPLAEPRKLVAKADAKSTKQAKAKPKDKFAKKGQRSRIPKPIVVKKV